jgi:hypothetical protein
MASRRLEWIPSLLIDVDFASPRKPLYSTGSRGLGELVCVLAEILYATACSPVPASLRRRIREKLMCAAQAAVRPPTPAKAKATRGS